MFSTGTFTVQYTLHSLQYIAVYSILCTVHSSGLRHNRVKNMTTKIKQYIDALFG